MSGARLTIAARLETFLYTTAVALGIGILIGAERERSKSGTADREILGVRTFALATLLGAWGAILGNSLVLAVFAFSIGAIGMAHYLRAHDAEPGVTSQIALLTAFALGALSLPYPAYSAGAAVVVTVLLASRPWLHDLVTRRMTDRELYDLLLLAAAVLIVLPLLPDRTIDPWQSLNPRNLWVVVVLVMAINAAGYLSLRWWGPRYGLLLTGLLGGLVSSVSTHGAMGQRAKEQPALVTAAAAAAMFSSVTTAVFLLTVVGAVDTALAITLAPAAIAAAVTSALYGWLLNAAEAQPPAAELPLGHPVSLRAGLLFGAVVSGVLLVSALLTETFGARAALASVAVAGLADAHSGAIAATILKGNGILSLRDAQVAVLCGFTTNAATKIAVSIISGPRGYALRVAGGVLVSIAMAWLLWWVTT